MSNYIAIEQDTFDELMYIIAELSKLVTARPLTPEELAKFNYLGKLGKDIYDNKEKTVFKL